MKIYLLQRKLEYRSTIGQGRAPWRYPQGSTKLSNGLPSHMANFDHD